MRTAMPVSNIILGEALLKFQTERINKNYPLTEEYNEEFSPNSVTDEKICKLIKLEKKPYYVLINTIGKRVACIIILILTMMTTTVFSVKALREPFINFIVSTYEKASAIIFKDGESKPNQSVTLSEFYEPEYLPLGYIKTYEEKGYFFYFCEFTDQDGNIINTENFITENAILSVNTENVEVERIFITNNKTEAIYYENKGVKEIVFSLDGYGFTVSGKVEKSELIKIAESMKKIE